MLRDRHLFVEEACSGIVSLLSIIACCAILAVWQNRPAPHAILLTVSGMLWAGILNVFRITILAIGLDRLGIDLSEGWRHEALGLVLFSGTLALSFCTDRLLLFLMSPISSPDTQVYGAYSQDNERPPILTRLFNVLVEPANLFRSGVNSSKEKSRGVAIPQFRHRIAGPVGRQCFTCFRRDFLRVVADDSIRPCGHRNRTLGVVPQRQARN